jgi:hypothetical protein
VKKSKPESRIEVHLQLVIDAEPGATFFVGRDLTSGFRTVCETLVDNICGLPNAVFLFDGIRSAVLRQQAKATLVHQAPGMEDGRIEIRRAIVPYPLPMWIETGVRVKAFSNLLPMIRRGYLQWVRIFWQGQSYEHHVLRRSKSEKKSALLGLLGFARPPTRRSRRSLVHSSERGTRCRSEQPSR